MRKYLSGVLVLSLLVVSTYADQIDGVREEGSQEVASRDENGSENRELYDVGLGPNARYRAPDDESRSDGVDFNKNKKKKENSSSGGVVLRANNCPGAFCKKDRPGAAGRFFVQAAAYYFQPRVSETDFVSSDSEGSALTYPIDGKMYEASLDWNWGFKVGFGYNSCGCGDFWRVAANYQRLNTTGSQSVQSTTGGLVPQLVSYRITDASITDTTETWLQFCNSAKLNTNFSFQSVDLGLCRSFFVSRRLSITPSSKLVASKIDYEQSVEYTGGTATTVPATGAIQRELLGLGGNNVKAYDKNNFKGIGPDFALRADWYLSENVSILSSLATTLLYGQFSIEHRESYSAVANNTTKLTLEKNQFLPGLEADLGLHFQSCFYEQSCQIAFDLLWNMQYFLSYNQSLRFDNSVFAGHYTPASGDLSMQSVKAELKISF